jgi:hypothetical protein
LGIRANTAVFSLLDAVFLKSLPVRDSHALVIFQWHGRTGPRYDELSSFSDCDDGYTEDSLWGCSFSSPMLDVLEAKTTSFDVMTGFAGPEEVHVSGMGTASVAATEIVSGEYFQTLSVRAAIGRTIEPSDDSPTASPVVVFSHGYWKRTFGGDVSIVGRTIGLNGIPVTIIGVADQNLRRIHEATVCPLHKTAMIRVDFQADPHYKCSQEECPIRWNPTTSLLPEE